VRRQLSLAGNSQDMESLSPQAGATGQPLAGDSAGQAQASSAQREADCVYERCLEAAVRRHPVSSAPCRHLSAALPMSLMTVWCFHSNRGNSLQQGLLRELLLGDGGTESVAHSGSWLVSSAQSP